MWHTETHRQQKEEANLNKNTKTDSSQKKKPLQKDSRSHIQNFRIATKPTRKKILKGKQRSKQTQENAEIPIPETAA